MRQGSFQHAAGTMLAGAALAGDHQQVAPAAGPVAIDEGVQRVMRLRLGQAVQVEAGLDVERALLQAGGLAAVE